MKFISVSSGIEAASAAWHPLGWRAFALSEIDRFPCAVLAHHYPDVPNLGDMTKFQEWPDAAIDVLVGGTPCQSFSVAGLRKGLADPRGNLMFTYLEIAARYRPDWLVWENVPGVLSSNGGIDFACLLQGLAELGYGFAYRVLDAQHFGVPQRRRRVFVVGCLGDWRRAAAVLFERHSLQGNPAPRRESRERVAPTISARTKGGGGLGTDFDCDGGLIAFDGQNIQDCGDLSATLDSGAAHGNRGMHIAFDCKAGGKTSFAIGEVAGALRGDGFGGGHAAVAFAENSRAELRLCGGDGQVAAQLTTGGGKPGQGQPCIAFQSSQSGVRTDDVHATLDSNNGSRRHNGAIHGSAVRRLTPRECERLQGFPDDYTLIQVRGKPAADGPRYKALGNSMAVPVMRWIGERISLVSTIAEAKAA